MDEETKNLLREIGQELQEVKALLAAGGSRRETDEMRRFEVIVEILTELHGKVYPGANADNVRERYRTRLGV